MEKTWDTVWDSLSETVALDDWKWNMKAVCVCVCLIESAVIPASLFWWITFLPPLATRWLSQWWRVASSCLSGGRWDVTAANMCPTTPPSTLPVQMINSALFVRFPICLPEQFAAERLKSPAQLPLVRCLRNNNNIENRSSSDKSYYNNIRQNNRVYRRHSTPDGRFLCQAGNGTELTRHHFSV